MYRLLFLCMKLIAIHAIPPTNARIGWRTAMEYLRDSQAIVVFNAADYYIDDLFLQNDHQVRPFVVYTRYIADVRQALFPNMTVERTKEIAAEPIGYVCLVNDEDRARVIIEDLGEHFPRAKIVIYTEKKITNLENVLELAWSNYDMMNVVVIHSADRIITLSVNNPFEKTKDGKWGHVHTFVANDGNVSAVLTATELMMNRRLMDMQNYPLNVSYYAPLIKLYSMGGNDVDILYTVEKIILNLMADRMKYRLIVIEPDDSYSGVVLIDMTSKRTNMMGNAVFMWDYGAERRIAFTKPYWSTEWCFIAPKYQLASPVIPLGPPLDTPSKMASLMTLLTCTLVWYFFRRYHNATSSPSLWKTLVDTFGLAISAPTDAPPNTPERLLFLMLAYYSLLMVNIYQGLIVTQVTTAKLDADINTLQQLEDFGLRIAVLPTTHNRFQTENTNSSPKSTFERLMQKAYSFPKLGISNDRTLPPTSASLLPRTMVETAVNDRYWNENGTDIFQMVDECAYAYYDAAVFPTTSPYIDRFNEIILLLHSNGMLSHWIQWRSEQTRLLRFRRIYQYNEGGLTKFTLLHHWIVFVMYGTCVCISILVFIAEILYNKLMK